METIEYKPLRKENYDALYRLIESVWGYHDYTDDEATRQLFVHLDALHSFIESNYGELAYLNGEVVGALLGTTKKRSNPLANLRMKTQLFIASFKLLAKGKHAAQGLNAFRRIGKIYKQMEKDAEKMHAEVKLFVTHPGAQGRGIGTKLMDTFLTHVRNKGIERVFLFTDTDCTYQYYDHKNFTRLDAKALTFDVKDRQKTMEVYMYAKTLK